MWTLQHESVQKRILEIMRYINYVILLKSNHL